MLNISLCWPGLSPIFPLLKVPCHLLARVVTCWAAVQEVASVHPPLTAFSTRPFPCALPSPVLQDQHLKILHVSMIPWCLLFCTWFISLKVMVTSSIHVIANNRWGFVVIVLWMNRILVFMCTKLSLSILQLINTRLVSFSCPLWVLWLQCPYQTYRPFFEKIYAWVLTVQNGFNNETFT